MSYIFFLGIDAISLCLGVILLYFHRLLHRFAQAYL